MGDGTITLIDWWLISFEVIKQKTISHKYKPPWTIYCHERIIPMSYTLVTIRRGRGWEICCAVIKRKWFAQRQLGLRTSPPNLYYHRYPLFHFKKIIWIKGPTVHRLCNRISRGALGVLPSIWLQYCMEEVGSGQMITDYIEMTESGTPLLMTEKLNLSVTVVGQLKKDPGEVKMHVGLVWAPSTG